MGKNTETGRKGFFARLIAKLDKKLQEQAKKGSCCCKSTKGGDASCSS